MADFNTFAKLSPTSIHFSDLRVFRAERQAKIRSPTNPKFSPSASLQYDSLCSFHMSHLRALSLLTLLVTTSAQAEGLRPWIGTNSDPLKSSFCRTYGCILQQVTRNTENTMGWHDGERRIYTTRDGAEFEVEVRPGGWISTVRLGFPHKARPNVDAGLGPADVAQEAAFLSNATGRRFTAGALAACHTAARELHRRSPDATSPLTPLNRWRTPLGRAYVARCSVGLNPSVWAGWMQE